jgi:hypothetical protein
MAALVTFRREFMDMTSREADEDGYANREGFKSPHEGIDPLKECVTIASACMKHFRMNHLPFNHLALVPERSYQLADNQSTLALKFMQWYAEEYNVEIRMAHSAGGEKHFGKYKADGWIEAEQRVIEVNGCAWHGCPQCYNDDQMMLPNGLVAGAKRQKDAERKEFIMRDPNVKEFTVFWECEIHRMLDADPDMRQKFAEYIDEGPLNIRDCFMGGRTGPMKLFHRAQPGEKISYLDVTSLYPYVNMMVDEEFGDIGYPVGHPTLQVLRKDVNWTKPEDNPHKIALMKVFVIPPPRIDVPVLPMKIDDDGRLLFPLCATCADENPTGCVDLDGTYRCDHTDRERGWVSKCTSLELNAALKEGYRVTKVIRVLEWKEGDSDLFRGYIREFMTEKFHATGFDSSIAGNWEAEEEFIHECAERFGIRIERHKMKSNKGRRQLVKLMLNNLWGRFSLRNYGLWQTHITDNPADVRDYLDNMNIEVMALDIVDEDEENGDTMMISYKTKKDFVVEHDCSNVGMFFDLW